MKRIITHRMIEAILARMHEGPALNYRSADLRTWNMNQFRLWQDGENKNVFKKNDAKMFGYFGEIFFKFVDEHAKFPKSLEELMTWVEANI